MGATLRSGDRVGRITASEERVEIGQDTSRHGVAALCPGAAHGRG